MLRQLNFMQLTRASHNPMLVNLQASQFATLQRQMFGTDSPAYSNNYHKGIYHLKTHAQRRQRCFSMKYSIQTMKPNVMRKTLHSDVLATSYQLWISTKARRCIMKAGSFDNYILNTKPETLHSRMAIHLRNLMLRKQKEGSKFIVPYVPGQATLPRTTRKRNWEYRNQPAIYMPLNVRHTEDGSEFYMKTPQEMSRLEIAELERELRELDDPVDDNEPKDVVRLMPEYLEYKKQIELLIPIRLGVIKRYWEKNKMNKRKREDILKSAEESEAFL